MVQKHNGENEINSGSHHKKNENYHGVRSIIDRNRKKKCIERMNTSGKRMELFSV